jgi:hypothetical protein
MWPHLGQGGGPRSPHQLAVMVTSAASYAPTWTPPPLPRSSWPGGAARGAGPPGAPWPRVVRMRVSFLLSDLLTPLVHLPSWSVMARLPVTSVGSVHGPFRLFDVFVAPQMVHNLLSIRQFTSDNSCSVEFDTSGLSVKDLATGRPLLRCDSTRPLYTLRLPVSAASTSPSSSSSAALAVTPSSTTWHHRLGHPGRDVLTQISRSDLSCTRTIAGMPAWSSCSASFFFFFTCFACF